MLALKDRLGLLLIMLMSFYLQNVRTQNCDKHGACSCKLTSGGIVDITSLGKTDNTPRFKDISYQTEQDYYSYNPCFPFTEGQCTDAAVCVLNSDKSQSIQIGDASSEGFKYDPDTNNVIVAYTSGDPTNLRLSEVILVCDQKAYEPQLMTNGQQPSGEFLLTLTTICACPDGCSSTGPNTTKTSVNNSAISAGSIFLIVISASLTMYLVFGIVIRKAVQKKEGIEVIPNIIFWKIIAVNVKDGFKCVIGKICNRKRSTYIST